MIVLQLGLANVVIPKLGNQSEYEAWKHKFGAILRNFNLTYEGVLAGTVNGDVKTTTAQQNLGNKVLEVLESTALALVKARGDETLGGMLKTFEEAFAIPSLAKSAQIFGTLNSAKLEPGMNISSFIAQKKEQARRIPSIIHTSCIDETVKLAVLNNLTKDYESVCHTLLARKNFTVSQMTRILVAHESTLLFRTDREEGDVALVSVNNDDAVKKLEEKIDALMVNMKSKKGGGKGGKGKTSKTCHRCGLPGHLKHECKTRPNNFAAEKKEEMRRMLDEPSTAKSQA